MRVRHVALVMVLPLIGSLLVGCTYFNSPQKELVTRVLAEQCGIKANLRGAQVDVRYGYTTKDQDLEFIITGAHTDRITLPSESPITLSGEEWNHYVIRENDVWDYPVTPEPTRAETRVYRFYYRLCAVVSRKNNVTSIITATLHPTYLNGEG